MKILFVIKKRESKEAWNKEDYVSYGYPSSGLLNSVLMISNKLSKEGIDTKAVEVIDNNCIDHEIFIYKPDVVIIEALWVVPSKFEILQKLYPKIKWIIRLHSNTPFIANEGIAFEWIYDYIKYPNMLIAANNTLIYKELKSLIGDKVIYLPNYYNIEFQTIDKIKEEGVINIGLFGAVRPLKNGLIQAIAAIVFANKYNLKLRFHINSTRTELNGNSILKNTRSLFANNPKHELVEVEWLNHTDFLKYIKRNIDVGMQVSFTETFNIVAADLISQDVPIVTSDEVEFNLRVFKANTTNVDSMVRALDLAYFLSDFKVHNVNKLLLNNRNNRSIREWKRYFK